MIIGAHSIINTTDAEADRDFFRDVFGLPYADTGGGWLIFGLPPSEVAFHPHDRNDLHEFYLMCDDVTAFAAEMDAKGVAHTEPHDEGWGILLSITLPGGGKLGVYEVRHPRPETPS